MGLDEIAAGHQLQSLHNTTIAWLGSANLFPIPWHQSASHISLSNKLLFQGKKPWGQGQNHHELRQNRHLVLGFILQHYFVTFLRIKIGFLQWQNFAIQRSLNIILEYNRVNTLSNLSFLRKKGSAACVVGSTNHHRFHFSPSLRCCNRSICLAWRPQVLNDQMMLEEVEKSTSSTTMGFPHLKVLIFCGGSSLISFFTLTSSRFTWDPQSTTGFLEFMVAAMFFPHKPLTLPWPPVSKARALKEIPVIKKMSS